LLSVVLWIRIVPDPHFLQGARDYPSPGSLTVTIPGLRAEFIPFILAFRL